MASANGEPLLSATITLPESGAWQSDIEVDVSREGSPALFEASEDGRVHVTLEHEGSAFVGTVARGSLRGARYQARLVGGAGGLETELDARSYVSGVGVRVRLVIGDALREAGETLSTSAHQDSLDRYLQRWTRSQGPANTAIRAVTKQLGLAWRVQRDGTVWVGPETYPEAVIDALLIDRDPADGSLILAAPEDGGGPLELDPGTTYLGARILEVVHRLEGNRFRTIAKTSTVARALEKVLGPTKKEIDYSRQYAARVSSQNADGTLELECDAPLFRGKGIGKVPILLGVPGSVEVPEGARCTILFEGGDEQKPRALLWSTTALSMLKVGAGAQFVALANLVDQGFADVRSALNALVSAYNSHAHVETGGTTGTPTSPGSSLSAIPTVAASKLKTE